ncbi:eCIS core domain-containing protein [Amycolatopsis sp. NPDC004772]
MRGHSHDNDLDPTLRPKGDRLERDDHDLLGRAAAAGRTDVLGPAGLLGLQRAVGNAGTSSLVEEDRSPVHDVVGSGGGAPLDKATREDMETRFGTDFSDVRVHTDSAAHDSAKSVNAQAYTVGSNIVFQRDKFDPASDSGKHMLAHELTHVVQQRSGPVDGTDAGGGVKVSDPSDRFEREAVANADRLMSAPAPAAAVQREEAPEAAEGEEDTMAQTFVQREEEVEEEA